MSTKKLIILGKEIKTGQTILNMDIARLHTRTRLEVPVIIEKAKAPGPTLLLTAGIHGNEVNGIEIIRRMVAEGLNKPTKGTIICIPVVNVFGFLNQDRQFPDGRDLNRMFPGTKSGSLASRFAYFVMNEIIPFIDYCIDFHTGGASRFNYSQIRVDSTNQECLKLAYVFGAKFIIDADPRDKSFRESLSKKGKIALLFEGGKSLHLDKNVTKSGIQGTLNIINYLGMRDYSAEIAQNGPPSERVYVKKSHWIRANSSGMYRRVIRIGEKVVKGQKIGSISDPYGDYEKNIVATNDGYIICSNHSPIVNQGDALIHISTEIDKGFTVDS